jgi:hypothetical protein
MEASTTDDAVYFSIGEKEGSGDDILRNLDDENPRMARPEYMASWGASLPLILAGLSAALAADAARSIAFSRNPLAMLCLGLCVLSICLVLVPRIFKWDWRAQYFGVAALYLSSVGLLGLIPWLSVVLYSTIPLWARLMLLLAYGLPIVWWCRRVILFYRHIFSEPQMRNMLYVEEADAVYYLQRSDKWLIEHKYKFQQSPPNLVFAFAGGIAFLMVPFMTSISHFFGLPFPHIFLMIGCFPLILLVSALAVHGYLVFYYYAGKMRSQTGKEVYVDMTAKPPTNHAAKRPTSPPPTAPHPSASVQTLPPAPPD